jgi:nitrosocyanin
MKNFVCLMLLTFSLNLLAQVPATKIDRVIKVVNHEFEGTKQWVPGTIVVMEGETVELQLINNVPSGIHGFEINDFKVSTSIKKGEVGKVTFKADKAGIFPINCQLHPAHVGGQLVVLKK